MEETNTNTNNKTTIIALLTAVFGFIVFKPEHFHAIPVLQDIAAYAFAGGLTAFAFVAKDK